MEFESIQMEPYLWGSKKRFKKQNQLLPTIWLCLGCCNWGKSPCRSWEFIRISGNLLRKARISLLLRFSIKFCFNSIQCSVQAPKVLKKKTKLVADSVVNLIAAVNNIQFAAHSEFCSSQTILKNEIFQTLRQKPEGLGPRDYQVTVRRFFQP